MKRLILLGVLCIAIGVAVLTGYELRSKMSAQTYKDMADYYNGQVERGTSASGNSLKSENTSEARITDAIEAVSGDQKVKKVKDYKNVLRIPSLHIKAYIYPDTSKTSLDFGVGHYEGTKAIGQKGKCVLAGHSSVTYNCILNGTDKLGVLDTFYAYDAKGKKHKYYITDTKKVNPTDVWVLDTDDTKYSYCMLLTCTNQGRQRLCLTGTEFKTEAQLSAFKKEYFADKIDELKDEVTDVGSENQTSKVFY